VERKMSLSELWRQFFCALHFPFICDHLHVDGMECDRGIVCYLSFNICCYTSTHFGVHR
jgi:hypothetical protein